MYLSLSYNSLKLKRTEIQADARPGHNVIILFTSVIFEYSNISNKLECLFLTSLSRLLYCLWRGPGVYHWVEHMKGSSIVQVFALPTNIRLGWKGLPGTNTLAYYFRNKLECLLNYARKAFQRKTIQKFVNHGQKMFHIIAPWAYVIKNPYTILKIESYKIYNVITKT